MINSGECVPVYIVVTDNREGGRKGGRERERERENADHM